MKKRTALITGSYGGFGTCFVKIHAGWGGDLILVGRSQQKLDEQAEAVKKKYGAEVHTIAADLSLPDAAQMIYDTCKQNGWKVDYLINNAGFASAGGLSDTKLFANADDPAKVAQDGYDGMLKGKLNVISGLPGWQPTLMKLAPMSRRRRCWTLCITSRLPEAQRNKDDQWKNNSETDR